MKTRLLILPCLLLLIVSYLPVKAYEGYDPNYSSSHPYEGMEGEHPTPPEGTEGEYPTPPEGWSPDNTSYSEEDFDMPESEKFERIFAIIMKIEEVFMALQAELEEHYNKNLNKVVHRLEDCVDIFNELTSEGEEELPTTCEDGIKWGLRMFSKAISLLEKRKCDAVGILSKRCIPVEIADKYVPKLRELYAELEKEVLADENEDGSPDVCDLFEKWEGDEEDWENHDHPPLPEEYSHSNLQ